MTKEDILRAASGYGRLVRWESWEKIASAEGYSTIAEAQLHVSEYARERGLSLLKRTDVDWRKVEGSDA